MEVINKNVMVDLVGLSRDLYLEALESNPDLMHKKIKACTAVGLFTLIILYENGQRELFDLYNHTRRYIDYESDILTTEESRKEFKYILARLMDISGYSQDDLSERLNISRKTIARYLSGQSLPGYLVLKRIADLFDCTVDDLYFKSYSREKHRLL